MRRSGIRGFFSGVEYGALQSVIEKSIYFYSYSTLRVSATIHHPRDSVEDRMSFLTRNEYSLLSCTPFVSLQGVCKAFSGGEFGTKLNLLVGYLAEVVHLPLTVPLEVCLP